MIRSGYLPTTGSLYQLREHEYMIPKSAAKRLGGSVLRAINDGAKIWIGADNGQWFDMSKAFSNIQLTMKEEKSMTKFNKGDKVKVSDRSIPSDYKIKYGETHTVDSVSADRVFLKGITGFYYESRFDLVATGWFNPGDKVKVVDAERTRYSKDEIVTVIEQTSNDNVRVMGANETVAVATALGGYYPWRFQLVDSLASTIAAVKKGDRVTVRTMLAPYAEFEVVVANLTYIGSANSEVLIRKVDIIELTITKPALPAEPGVGAIVKFTEAHHNSAYQIRDENGWIPIRDNGFVSPTHYTWERTLVDVGPEFEVIREGGK